MALLTREQILETDDKKFEIINVPEWGGEVKVIGITAKARDQWEMKMSQQKSNGRPVDVRASLCAKSIVDESGSQIFSDSDIKALGEKSALSLERVFSVAVKLSGLSDNDIEELEGN